MAYEITFINRTSPREAYIDMYLAYALKEIFEGISIETGVKEVYYSNNVVNWNWILSRNWNRWEKTILDKWYARRLTDCPEIEQIPEL